MWRDVLLANVISSLVKPLVDLNHFACYSWTECGHGGGDKPAADREIASLNHRHTDADMTVFRLILNLTPAAVFAQVVL